jgi:predicted ATPase/DNA-binding CsgD family transcriptional regulator/Tfp pilus assembly protein PilF
MPAVSDAPTSAPPIPAPLSSVLGRTTELDQILALLEQPTTRLVTLTGPGGVGKTRLAQLVATTLVDEFGRDLAWVPLAALTDPVQVLPAICQALGIDPAPGEDPLDALATALAERAPLLILDNLEHLLPVADTIDALLGRCPTVTILATSQAPLGLAHERLLPIPPLTTADPAETASEAILRADAVRLFVTRARAMRPQLTIDDHAAVTIAQICRQLDGLPLAIELAAARMTILTPESLLARLGQRLRILGGSQRDVPDRLRTMRSAIAWSYDLLDPDEQRLFRFLSVYAGGFPREAAGASAGDDAGRSADTLLSALIDHSLVQVTRLPGGPDRFLILETLRAYGQEQLTQRQEVDAAHRAHATFILDFAEAAEPHLFGPEQHAWLTRLKPEWDNVRAAVEWALEHGQPEITLRLMAALSRVCTAHGHVTEARAWLDQALAATASEPSMSRSRALVTAGNLAEDQGDLDHARELFIEGQELAITLGDTRSEAVAQIGQGYVAHDRGEYAAALRFHQRAAVLARAMGDRHLLGRALGNFAAVSYYQGQLDDARRSWEEAQEIFHELGDHMIEALAIGNLGAVASEQGDFARSEQLQRQALALQRQLGNTPSIALALINLADLAQQRGDVALAYEQLDEALPMLRSLGFKGAEGIGLNTLAAAAFAEGDLPRAASHLLESVRLLAEVGDQLSIAGNTDLLAKCCAASGRPTVAIELMAAAATLRTRLGSTPNTFNQGEIDALEARLRADVSEAEFARHQQAGAAHDFEGLVRRLTILARELAGPGQPLPEQPPAEPEVVNPLTAREIEVLGLVADGKSTRVISDELFISPRTTTTHMNNILRKLEVTSRTAAVAWALRHGVLTGTRS